MNTLMHGLNNCMGTIIYNSKTFFIIKMALLKAIRFEEAREALEDDAFDIEGMINLVFGKDFKPLRLELIFNHDAEQVNPATAEELFADGTFDDPRQGLCTYLIEVRKARLHSRVSMLSAKSEG